MKMLQEIRIHWSGIDESFANVRKAGLPCPGVEFSEQKGYKNAMPRFRLFGGPHVSRFFFAKSAFDGMKSDEIFQKLGKSG